MTTTRKPYHGQDGPVTFGRPTIGPRVYLVRGPSGWSETYDRKQADAALAKFIAPLDLRDVISTFVTAVRLEDEEETWADVMNHLAKLTQQAARAIPEIIGVAFWASVILHEETEGTN